MYKLLTMLTCIVFLNSTNNATEFVADTCENPHILAASKFTTGVTLFTYGVITTALNLEQYAKLLQTVEHTECNNFSLEEYKKYISKNLILSCGSTFAGMYLTMSGIKQYWSLLHTRQQEEKNP